MLSKEGSGVILLASLLAHGAALTLFEAELAEHCPMSEHEGPAGMTC
jgi:hypothetical protein